MNRSTSPRWLVVLSILYGFTLLVWLSAEDTVWLVAVFGAGLSVLLVLHSLLRLVHHRTISAHRRVMSYIIAGIVAGAGGILATLLLMLIKTSIHGHLYPDYSFPLMVSMASRLPAWAAAGGLIGLAVALVSYRREESDDPGGLS